MHARVVTVQIRPAKMRGAVLIYREVVLPLLQAQPGLCEARLLTDEHTGRGLLVTLWANEAAMQAVEARGVFHEEIAHFQPVLGSPPSRECYEVSVSAGGHGGGSH
ncbi:antibiotic biosynthesis monooxygenase family protein [Deinococcus planocerae]|uniref:antibiotic biosynthesis monooxygenase family protein n=1 Tax=Deinococcus planocerae TaxID=1737569 RepID=UPI000C7EE9EF|nr:antibiotic biosynthesis monooxygenase [Deinococcus planocerae]